MGCGRWAECGGVGGDESGQMCDGGGGWREFSWIGDRMG